MTGKICFLLDGKIREMENVNPTHSLLNWLRYDEQRTGTKEGCGEGDCGACTVVVGELVEECIEYRAVNACLIFLPTMHGRELLTVESLKGPEGSLHPVQQALVDCHGSQCGFCTPGFVMSLYVLYLNYQGKEKPTLQQINDCLAGNLCRCTGYGPIIRSAENMFDYPHPEQELPQPDKVALLEDIRQSGMISLSYSDKVTGTERQYFAPASRDELADIRQKNPQAILLSGGTDVGLWVSKQHRDLPAIIYLGNVQDMKQMLVKGRNLHLGAAVTYSRAMERIAQLYPDFGEVIRRIGSTQIRNQGTIGGNIANGSPIGDTPPCLLVLGAKIEICRGDQSRIIALEDFFIDYGQQDLAAGEFISEIILPLPRDNQTFRAYKITKRFDQDISALCMAISYSRDGAMIRDVRIAYGGMAAIPRRAVHAEKILEGKSFTKGQVRQAMAGLDKDFTPISDMRASADYRMRVAKNLLMKACLEAKGETVRVLEMGEVAHG